MQDAIKREDLVECRFTNMKNSIFELRQLIDPRYGGLISDKKFQFGPKRSRSRDWTVPLLGSAWKPPKVEGSMKSLWHDFPCLDIHIPVFSRRAVDILRLFLEPNGEILPLITTSGDFYAYNLTTVADILDTDRSKIRWAGPGIVSSIDYFVFDENKAEKLTIFRIPEDRVRTYVTQAFVDAAEKNGLLGMNFVKVWPYPPDIDWMLVEKDKSEARSRRGLPDGKDSGSETIVIRLKLDGKGKGSVQEHARIDSLMDRLESMLVEFKPDSSLPDYLEGHEYENGECCIYIGCAEAKMTLEKILPSINEVNWPNDIEVIARFGRYWDTEAEESRVPLARPILKGGRKLEPKNSVVPSDLRQ